MSRFGLLWVCVVVAVGVVYAGLYRNVGARLAYAWSLWSVPWRAGALPSIGARARREVAGQAPIRGRGTAAWVRHLLISWGFVVLFVLDILFALLTRYAPTELFVTGAGRDALDLGLDAAGGALLAGLVLALLVDRGGGRYGDRLAVGFLLVVVLTGFLAEAARLAGKEWEPRMAFSFVGAGLAALLRPLPWPWAEIQRAAWIVHATLCSCWIAYVGWSRMVHVLATPVGRLLQPRRELLEARIDRVVREMVRAGER